MLRDKNGVPIIGARDVRPVKVLVVQNEKGLMICDQETQRPIPVVQAQWTATPQGAQLVLFLSGPMFALDFKTDATQVTQPARITRIDGRDTDLVDGEQIPLVDANGRPMAVLSVQLVKQEEPQPAPS